MRSSYCKISRVISTLKFYFGKNIFKKGVYKRRIMYWIIRKYKKNPQYLSSNRDRNHSNQLNVLDYAESEFVNRKLYSCNT